MSEQHEATPRPEWKATPEQWVECEIGACMWRREFKNIASCLLELRARVEALEATQHAHIDTSSLWQPVRSITPLNGDPSKRLPDPQPGKQPRVFAAEEVVVPSPAGSLVERVGAAIGSAPTMELEDEARAAILEVAAWIRSELNGRNVADRLEQEANR